MTFAANFEIVNAFMLGLCVMIAAVVLFFKYKFRYWKTRGVPLVEEAVIPWGTNMSPFKPMMYIGEYFKTVYDKSKRLGNKHAGRFMSYLPNYFALDPEYIKNILQRDFDHFAERNFYYNEKDDPLSANLFAIGGDKWKIMRKHLSPAFTSGKLKMLFDDMVQCACQLKDAVERSRQNQRAVNVQDIFERYTIDVIGSCVFGLRCDSFKNPHSEFTKHGRKIFQFTIWRICKVFFSFCFPQLARRLGVRLFEDDTTQFFVNIVKNAMVHRNCRTEARKDFLQLLLELQHDNASKQRPFSVEELTAQAFIFFAAGFETSSRTLTFCLYELAINADVQDKLREEIRQTGTENGGKFTYDTIMNMKYLNQVVEETLRKYPPVSFITRTCVEDYLMPGTATVIEKGISIIIPILGLHRDADYYPDPDKFDPERFSHENKARICPFTYLPFGEGPRICIGMRFGLLQVKTGLALLLNEYEFTLNDKSQTHLELDSFTFTMTPKRTIFLNAAKTNRGLI